MTLETSWPSLEQRLRELAESSGEPWSRWRDSDRELNELDLVNEDGDLTEHGNAFYMARFVLDDREGAAKALGDTLARNPVVNTFCESLWATKEIPVGGAVGFLRRITKVESEAAAKRWLALMNAGKVIAYNRNKPRVRVLYNPSALVPPDEDTKRERTMGHTISPDTPYGNLLHLRQLIGSAVGYLDWYEQHLPPKVMEILYREVPQGQLQRIRLLSGPAALTPESREEFKRFRKEMSSKRSIKVEWRVLSKKKAQDIHGRFFISTDLVRNIPPVNSILKGSTDEMLPSNLDPSEFDNWWAEGVDLVDFPLAT